MRFFDNLKMKLTGLNRSHLVRVNHVITQLRRLSELDVDDENVQGEYLDNLIRLDTMLLHIRNSFSYQRSKLRYTPRIYDVVEYIGENHELDGKVGYIKTIIPKVINNTTIDSCECTEVIVSGDLQGAFYTKELRLVVY